MSVPQNEAPLENRVWEAALRCEIVTVIVRKYSIDLKFHLNFSVETHSYVKHQHGTSNVRASSDTNKSVMTNGFQISL